MEVLHFIGNNTLVTKAVAFEVIDTNNKLVFDSVVVSHPLHIAVLAMVLLRRKI